MIIWNIYNMREKNIIYYQDLIDTHSEIELKGKNMMYTSVNGHMFSIMNKDGSIGLRLEKDVRVQFIEDHQTKLHESYGAIMREYVRIPNSLISKTEILKPYLAQSYDYVKSLKPKSTKKK